MQHIGALVKEAMAKISVVTLKHTLRHYSNGANAHKVNNLLLRLDTPRPERLAKVIDEVQAFIIKEGGGK